MTNASEKILTMTLHFPSNFSILEKLEKWYTENLLPRFITVNILPFDFYFSCVYFAETFYFLFWFLILTREHLMIWERNINMRETSIGCLLYTSELGIEPAIQVCALTWNGTCSLLWLTEQCSYQLSHPAAALTCHIWTSKEKLPYYSTMTQCIGKNEYNLKRN